MGGRWVREVGEGGLEAPGHTELNPMHKRGEESGEGMGKDAVPKKSDPGEEAGREGG